MSTFPEAFGFVNRKFLRFLENLNSMESKSICTSIREIGFKAYPAVEKTVHAGNFALLSNPYQLSHDCVDVIRNEQVSFWSECNDVRICGLGFFRRPAIASITKHSGTGDGLHNSGRRDNPHTQIHLVANKDEAWYTKSSFSGDLSCAI